MPSLPFSHWLQKSSLVLVLMVLVSSVSASNPPSTPAPIAFTPKPLARMPRNQPEKGMIYDGLEIATSGPCVGMFQIIGSNQCTHGPDEPLPGTNVFVPTPLVAAAVANQPQEIGCEGNGTAGNRIQVMYVRASDRPDRYATVLASIQTWAAQMDAIYADSAAATGGVRHIRFVTQAVAGGCAVSVLNIVLSPTGDDDFNTTRDELSALGYNRQDRKYSMFVDAARLCGIGSLSPDDRFAQTNWNNVGPDYARTDTGCWGAHTGAHELGHNLGSVQLSAPHSTTGSHCVDERDVMCY